MKPVGECDRWFQVADFRKDDDIVNGIERTAYEEKHDKYNYGAQIIVDDFFYHIRLYFIKEHALRYVNNLFIVEFFNAKS